MDVEISLEVGTNGIFDVYVVGNLLVLFNVVSIVFSVEVAAVWVIALTVDFVVAVEIKTHSTPVHLATLFSVVVEALDNVSHSEPLQLFVDVVIIDVVPSNELDLTIDDWEWTIEETAGDVVAVCKHIELVHSDVEVSIDERVTGFVAEVLVVDVNVTGVEVVKIDVVIMIEEALVGEIGWSTLELHFLEVVVDVFDNTSDVCCSGTDDLIVVWVIAVVDLECVDVTTRVWTVLVVETLHDSWVHVVVNISVDWEVLVTLIWVSVLLLEASEEVNGHQVV